MRRNKRKHFNKNIGGYSSKEKTEYNFLKATMEQLDYIGKRLKSERRLRWIKIILLTVLGFLGIVAVLYYVVNY